MRGVGKLRTKARGGRRRRCRQPLWRVPQTGQPAPQPATSGTVRCDGPESRVRCSRGPSVSFSPARARDWLCRAAGTGLRDAALLHAVQACTGRLGAAACSPLAGQRATQSERPRGLFNPAGAAGLASPDRRRSVPLGGQEATRSERPWGPQYRGDEGRSAGPPQARPAPSGGREPHAVGSVEAQNLPAVLRLAIRPLRKPCAPR
jgi:hypothetical protein